MPELKIGNMHAAAEKAQAAADGTTSGTWVTVGWDGKSITCGDKIRKSIPHIRVNVAKDDTLDAIETALAMAVMELRRALPPALARWKTPAAPPRPGTEHSWAKPGQLKKARHGK